MQETTFPIEILIHDDASTDGTDDIIREYASKYSGKIFPLFEEENQYSIPGHKHMDLYNYERARGEYIAYCEGDDYWTDPFKLQKQVDFLEANPEYSVCFHRCKRLSHPSGRIEKDACESCFIEKKYGVDISIEMFFKQWITQPLTMVFRKSCFDFHWQERYRMYRDTIEIYHLLNVGKGFLFSFEGGVHIWHDDGISSSIGENRRMIIEYDTIKELFQNNKDDYYVKEYLSRIIRYRIEKGFFNGNIERLKLLIEYLYLKRSIKYIIKRVLSGHLRG